MKGQNCCSATPATRYSSQPQMQTSSTTGRGQTWMRKPYLITFHTSPPGARTSIHPKEAHGLSEANMTCRSDFNNSKAPSQDMCREEFHCRRRQTKGYEHFPKVSSNVVFSSSKTGKQSKTGNSQLSENATLAICSILIFMSNEAASTALKLLIYLVFQPSTLIRNFIKKKAAIHMFVNHFLYVHRAELFAYVINSTPRWRAPEEGIFYLEFGPQQWIKLLLMLMKLLSFKAIFRREGDISSYRNASKEKVGLVERKHQHRSTLYNHGFELLSGWSNVFTLAFLRFALQHTVDPRRPYRMYCSLLGRLTFRHLVRNSGSQSKARDNRTLICVHAPSVSSLLVFAQFLLLFPWSSIMKPDNWILCKPQTNMEV